MREITKKLLKDHWLGLTLISVSLIFYGWFLASIYKSVAKALNIEKIFKSYPEALKAFFGGPNVSLTTFEGYLNVELFSLMLIIIVGGYLIALATSEITKEVETGTIESLLSLPVSRFKIIFTKWLNMVAISIGLTILTTVPIYIFAKLYDVHVSLKGIYFVSLLTVLFFVAIGSFTMAMSVIFNDRSKAIFIPIALLAFGYIWNSIAQIYEKIKDYRFISVFYYYDSARALTQKEIAFRSWALFAVIIVVSTAFTFYWFSRRDFAV